MQRSVYCALLVFSAAIAWSACTHSPTIDETGHLPAGLSHWYLGRYEAYAVNPPLIRMIATFPVLAMAPETDWTPFRKRNLTVADRVEWPLGRRFIHANGPRSLKMWCLARLSLIPLVLLGAISTLQLGRESGNIVGFVALLLYCLSPDILGHGSLMTPDASTSALAALTVLALLQWCKNLSLRTTLGLTAAGTALMMAKATFIIVLPIIFCFSIFLRYALWPREMCVLSFAKHSFLIVVLSITLINMLYAFDGTGTPMGDIQFKSQLLSRNPIPGITWPTNRLGGTWLGDFPCPVPVPLLQGIDVQRGDFEQGYRSYLCGEWKHGGWWYYYLLAFVVKQPIGFQLMLYVSVLTSLWRWKSWTRESVFRWSVILLPSVIVVALVSSQTGFNHHIRYILPAFPFLFVVAARIAREGVLGKSFVVMCLTSQCISVVSAGPNWLSYFNEGAGGPRAGHYWLLDSNIDWGQDIFGLLEWQKGHPETDLCCALFAAYDPHDIGLQFKLPPPYVLGHPELTRADGARGPLAGWYAIGVCQLKGHQFLVTGPDGQSVWSDGQFNYFMDHFEPVDMIGYSIYIYHITEKQAAEVRRKLANQERLLLETSEQRATQAAFEFPSVAPPDGAFLLKRQLGVERGGDRSIGSRSDGKR